MAKYPKRPRDPAQLAKLIVDIATGEASDEPEVQMSDQAKLGRMGGLKGGRARAAILDPKRRQEIARKGRPESVERSNSGSAGKERALIADPATRPFSIPRMMTYG